MGDARFERYLKSFEEPVPVSIRLNPKKAAGLEVMPMLKDIYNEKTGHKMMVFHLEDATAVDIPMMGPGEDLLA